MLHRTVAVFVISVVVACGNDPSQPSQSYTGRVVKRTIEVMVDGTSTRDLSTEIRSSLESQGFRIDDERNQLIGPDRDGAGYWVKLEGDDTLYVTDHRGTFYVPSLGARSTTVAFYRQLADTEPERVFPLVRDGNHQTYTIEVMLGPPGDMNSAGSAPVQSPVTQVQELFIGARAAVTFPDNPKPVSFPGQKGSPLADGCPSRCDTTRAEYVNDTSGSEGCCLDYDGRFGDGQPREHDPRKIPADLEPLKTAACLARALTLNWLGSTCWHWVHDKDLMNACDNEWASRCASCGLKRYGLPIPAGAPGCEEGCPAQPADGKFPSCYHNHKYRNCQNLDPNGFSITPRLTITPPGTTAQIHVFNNTPQNSTKLSVAEGTMALAATSANQAKLVPLGGGVYRLDHWSDEKLRHARDVDLVYTPPPTPKSCIDRCGNKTVTLTAEAAPHVLTVTIVLEKRQRRVASLEGQPAVLGVEGEVCLLPPDEECEPPDESASDILTVDAIAQDFTLGDSISSGPSTLRVRSVGYPGDVVAAPVDVAGRFHFTIDCSNGGGPCAAALPLVQYCGGEIGLNSSTPTLQLVPLDFYFVDGIFEENMHYRPEGRLFHGPYPYHPALGWYSHIWASEPATVTGSCFVGQLNLTLKRGWNAVHIVPMETHLEISTATPSTDFPWYYVNQLINDN